ncbi:DNA repair protein RadC [Gracilibacillus dipsosauri]|uniref:DNA repair protein RadC n=1 Tax=Gracilibacillus dipsosauri TaxID=178340 RepID=A0A317KXX1_9BACI|nr:DNA repair protein RadC [Gracilibacillus dipsosauri]
METWQGACSLPYDPAPSQEDIHVTKRLVESGKMIGIEMLDHLIIGDRRFISLKEKGYL